MSICIDTAKPVSYDSVNPACRKSAEFFTLPVTNPTMATPENSFITSSSVSGRNDSAELCPAASAKACPDPTCQQELLSQYTQLRENFQRCTNALASAAHDLKTPLSIVSGYIELLQSEKLGSLNDKQREVLHDMRSSSQRLQHFIQDFLTFTVLETG